ncbi:hypothetical protein ADUPG1_006511 [Aduncisulcus paluster]|uniref:Uncharacterized protein n=1 Tax=Aduncisulcus paluster TaxID=2918883 RepID=A0ABQ5KK97_9EUKA|nr:hypothetical protein ADUPG1_006511 [Aduncisulcus paluster]
MFKNLLKNSFGLEHLQEKGIIADLYKNPTLGIHSLLIIDFIAWLAEDVIISGLKYRRLQSMFIARAINEKKKAKKPDIVEVGMKRRFAVDPLESSASLKTASTIPHQLPPPSEISSISESFVPLSLSSFSVSPSFPSTLILSDLSVIDQALHPPQHLSLSVRNRLNIISICGCVRMLAVYEGALEEEQAKNRARMKKVGKTKFPIKKNSSNSSSLPNISVDIQFRGSIIQFYTLALFHSMLGCAEIVHHEHVNGMPFVHSDIDMILKLAHTLMYPYIDKDSKSEPSFSKSPELMESDPQLGDRSSCIPMFWLPNKKDFSYLPPIYIPISDSRVISMFNLTLSLCIPLLAYSNLFPSSCTSSESTFTIALSDVSSVNNGRWFHGNAIKRKISKHSRVFLSSSREMGGTIIPQGTDSMTKLSTPQKNPTKMNKEEEEEKIPLQSKQEYIQSINRNIPTSLVDVLFPPPSFSLDEILILLNESSYRDRVAVGEQRDPLIFANDECLYAPLSTIGIYDLNFDQFSHKNRFIYEHSNGKCYLLRRLVASPSVPLSGSFKTYWEELICYLPPSYILESKPHRVALKPRLCDGIMTLVVRMLMEISSRIWVKEEKCRRKKISSSNNGNKKKKRKKVFLSSTHNSAQIISEMFSSAIDVLSFPFECDSGYIPHDHTPTTVTDQIVGVNNGSTLFHTVSSLKSISSIMSRQRWSPFASNPQLMMMYNLSYILLLLGLNSLSQEDQDSIPGSIVSQTSSTDESKSGQKGASGSGTKSTKGKGSSKGKEEEELEADDAIISSDSDFSSSNPFSVISPLFSLLEYIPNLLVSFIKRICGNSKLSWQSNKSLIMFSLSFFILPHPSTLFLLSNVLVQKYFQYSKANREIKRKQQRETLKTRPILRAGLLWPDLNTPLSKYTWYSHVDDANRSEDSLHYAHLQENMAVSECGILMQREEAKIRRERAERRELWRKESMKDPGTMKKHSRSSHVVLPEEELGTSEDSDETFWDPKSSKQGLSILPSFTSLANVFCSSSLTFSELVNRTERKYSKIGPNLLTIDDQDPSYVLFSLPSTTLSLLLVSLLLSPHPYTYLSLCGVIMVCIVSDCPRGYTRGKIVIETLWKCGELTENNLEHLLIREEKERQNTKKGIASSYVCSTKNPDGSRIIKDISKDTVATIHDPRQDRTKQKDDGHEVCQNRRRNIPQNQTFIHNYCHDPQVLQRDLYHEHGNSVKTLKYSLFDKSFSSLGDGALSYPVNNIQLPPSVFSLPSIPTKFSRSDVTYLPRASSELHSGLETGSLEASSSIPSAPSLSSSSSSALPIEEIVSLTRKSTHSVTHTQEVLRSICSISMSHAQRLSSVELKRWNEGIGMDSPSGSSGGCHEGGLSLESEEEQEEISPLSSYFVPLRHSYYVLCINLQKIKDFVHTNPVGMKAHIHPRVKAKLDRSMYSQILKPHVKTFRVNDFACSTTILTSLDSIFGTFFQSVWYIREMRGIINVSHHVLEQYKQSFDPIAIKEMKDQATAALAIDAQGSEDDEVEVESVEEEFHPLLDNLPPSSPSFSVAALISSLLGLVSIHSNQEHDVDRKEAGKEKEEESQEGTEMSERPFKVLSGYRSQLCACLSQLVEFCHTVFIPNEINTIYDAVKAKVKSESDQKKLDNSKKKKKKKSKKKSEEEESDISGAIDAANSALPLGDASAKYSTISSDNAALIMICDWIISKISPMSYYIIEQLVVNKVQDSSIGMSPTLTQYLQQWIHPSELSISIPSKTELKHSVVSCIKFMCVQVINGNRQEDTARACYCSLLNCLSLVMRCEMNIDGIREYLWERKIHRQAIVNMCAMCTATSETSSMLGRTSLLSNTDIALLNEQRDSILEEFDAKTLKNTYGVFLGEDSGISKDKRRKLRQCSMKLALMFRIARKIEGSVGNFSSAITMIKRRTTHIEPAEACLFLSEGYFDIRSDFAFKTAFNTYFELLFKYQNGIKSYGNVTNMFYILSLLKSKSHEVKSTIDSNGYSIMFFIGQCIKCISIISSKTNVASKLKKHSTDLSDVEITALSDLKSWVKNCLARVNWLLKMIKSGRKERVEVISLASKWCKNINRDSEQKQVDLILKRWKSVLEKAKKDYVS